MILKIKLHDADCMPVQNGDWIDLKSMIDMEYEAGEFFMIPLGVSMALPERYEAHVLPRSSTFKNYGIIMTNGMGIIDNAYRGDMDMWKFPAWSLRGGRIRKGDRIAQFRIIRNMGAVAVEPVESLGFQNRGGFGSTGR